MKKLTLLIMACAVAIMGFAQGGTITYELNGGVTNEYGWANKNDMFLAFGQEVNASFNWQTLDHWKAMDNPFPSPNLGTGINSCLILNTNEAKWGWLKTYVLDVTTKQIAEGVDATALGTDNTAVGGAAWRYAVAAFFVEKRYTGWPKSADFTLAGDPAAFLSFWKKGFVGPATYDGSVEVELPLPYKENWIFDGWFEESDFTGGKITKIAAGAEGNKTFYAKWIDVPYISDIWALGTGGVSTKAGGIVTYAAGSEAYVQDISGGLWINFTAAQTLKAGDKITVQAKTAANGDLIKLIDAELLTKEDATIPIIQKISLATLLADASNHYKTYMYEYVEILGLKITAYDGDGYATLADDVNRTIKLGVKLNQATYVPNTKVNLKATVGFDGALQLLAYETNVTVSPVPRPDPYAYPALEEGKYTLTSKWLVSNKLDNLGANPVGILDHVRGMAAKNGKMYFIDRDQKQLTVVDGATGEKLPPVKLAPNIFTYDDNGETKVAGTLPYNDIKIDGAGNILIGNCITSSAGVFQVWKVDENTGAGTLIVQERLSDNPDYVIPLLRFDAFGVYGNVNENAIIMTINNEKLEAFKWTITNGVAGEAELIELVPDANDIYYLNKPIDPITAPGTASQIFPVDEYLFYVDGFNMYPTLFNMNGLETDGFYRNQGALSDALTKPGTTYSLRTEHNGLIEFSIGDEHFLIIAATGTQGVPPSAYRLFKWKDANKLFAEMESLWTFPADGMGGATNQYRTAVPSVEVNEVTGVATLYLYAGENGYGVYEFKSVPTGIRSTFNNEAIQVRVNGKTLLFNEEVANVSVYTITGQLATQAKNVNAVNVSGNGIFVVKATTLKGETAVHKVIVK